MKVKWLDDDFNDRKLRSDFNHHESCYCNRIFTSFISSYLCLMMMMMMMMIYDA